MDVFRETTVIKRSGKKEEMSFDKILNRVKKLGVEANISINITPLVAKVIDQLYDDIPTHKIDELTAEQCATSVTQHLDYGKLASRIVISNNHKNTSTSFSETMERLYNFKDIHGDHKPLLSDSLINIVRKHSNALELMIDNSRDYLIDYFGFKTLERAYLMKLDGVVLERIQYMWLRVSIGIHGDPRLPTAEFLSKIKTTYDLMSQKYFIHATPTLYNSGTPRPQCSSCFLLGMEEDSIDGIYNTLKNCAKISKYAGGIGLHIHNIRANGSHINGTNGTSNGIVPMLKVFNDTARYVDQGGGKRNGSFAIYLENWHADIFDFLELKKNHGEEETKARDLFYALWLSDLFMERVENDKDWTLMCPHECPGLAEVYGDEFKSLYEKYEAEGRGRKTIKARQLWFSILDSQMETGTPYILYKDACNKKSNQKNLGTIKSSNLCTEIVEYSDSNETAVCNLASIALPRYVREDKTFDYEKLHEVTKIITENLNKIIDINFYPTNKTRKSNMLHRPIGIGVQGLADTFILMGVAYSSEEAAKINRDIFETIYHASVECSNEMAIKRHGIMVANKDAIADHVASSDSDLYISGINVTKNESVAFMKNNNTGGSYSTFENSPTSEGILQFDMWNVTPSDRYDWYGLKTSIKCFGIRNSLLLAPMPTASTSQILGNNECFEPFTSNIYSRRTNAGEFVLVNKYLMNELQELGLWSQRLKDNIIANKGSIQHLDMISDEIKEKYKIVWEIPMKHMINMARDRGAFICQSQSLNLWQENPNYKSLTAMHFYSWKQGLKTGIYYLRRKPRHQAQQFTLDPSTTNVERNENEEICEMCSA